MLTISYEKVLNLMEKKKNTEEHLFATLILIIPSVPWPIGKEFEVFKLHLTMYLF